MQFTGKIRKPWIFTLLALTLAPGLTACSKNTGPEETSTFPAPLSSGQIYLSGEHVLRPSFTERTWDISTPQQESVI